MAVGAFRNLFDIRPYRWGTAFSVASVLPGRLPVSRSISAIALISACLDLFRFFRSFESNTRHQGLDHASDDMAAIHSDEFKRDAVRIAQTSGLTRRQVASDLGIGHSTLGKGGRVFSEEAKVPAQDVEASRARTNGCVKRTAYSGFEPDKITVRGAAVFPSIGVYLAVILDLFSRRVTALRDLHAKPFRVKAWAISNRLKPDLALRALNMAVALRRPPQGCIHHTDRGSQYCAHSQKLLRQHGFKPSMSGKDNCHDNSAVESFFKSLKAELVWRRNWQTRREVEVALFEYINRIHQRLIKPAPKTLNPRLEITRGFPTEGRFTLTPDRHETGPDAVQGKGELDPWLFHPG